ncbi:hypothetical protein GCK72_014638 [Caenorhabditis remanei]|uniref:Protein asunder n=1 Tax=Caenorhabditis remanei TaxID=31234 RepID=A0A6A5GS01_CAERE|nr:hypothetical protein GCK72_014638 [Caenorhabditis remanei]KAF1758180.1 hypothetical protein GCK72_014638 [Caenorhabditis remanei]
MEQLKMKTVIMLDRSAKFIDDSNETFDIAIREGPKQKKVEFKKDIWTWCMEGLFEMQRVLADVYPLGNIPIRFAVADYMGKMLETEWKNKLLSREELGKIVVEIGRPSESNTDITPVGGLTMAIEALAVETPEQKEYNYDIRYNLNKRTSQNSEVVRVTNELKNTPLFSTVENKGNLILFTRLKTEDEMEALQKEVASLVVSRNSIANAPSNKTFCPITALRVFIVNYYAVGEDCTVKTHPLLEHPELPLLKFWVISRKVTDMCVAIHSLLVASFDLGSTTVTKIPMKEDNRGSTNYDVELFHSGQVHTLLKEKELIAIESKKGRADEGPTYDSIRLTWTTAPKSRWSLFPYHGAAVPCTTAVAYSRPSACLTQFVRDGRCVMLDSEKTSEFGMNMPEKLVSHILIANRGRIFIQEIDFMQKKFDKSRVVRQVKFPKATYGPKDPINLNQLKHTYKQMELKLVAKNRMNEDMTEKREKKWKALKNSNIEKRFSRISKNIPAYADDTFIFQPNVTNKLEPLITMITKKKLTPADVEQCKAKIMKIHQMRALKEFIVPEEEDIELCPVEDLSDPEEQIRVAIVELAKHLVKYVTYSDRHSQIYKTFMTTLGADKLLKVDAEDYEAVDNMFPKSPFFDGEESEDSDSSDSSDFSENSDSEEAEESDESEDSENTLTTFLNNSLDRHRLPSQKRKISKVEVVKEKPIQLAKDIEINIFAKMCDMLEKKESQIRREFVGREAHGNKAPLYLQLMEKLEKPASPSTSGDRSERTERTDRPDRIERTERVERIERLRNLERGGSGTPPPIRRPYN